MENDKKKIIIGITGSVAAIRLPEIVEKFSETKKFEIVVVITKYGKFFTDTKIKDYKEFSEKYNIKIYFDNDEFDLYSKDESRVLHIELRKWADAIILAPLTANTLGKITNGLCDNLLTSIVRAWDFNKKGFFCLAMNTLMYENFITEKQIKILLNEFHFIQIPSKVKKLKCGDYGIGGIADTDDIIKIVCDNLGIKIN